MKIQLMMPAPHHIYEDLFLLSLLLKRLLIVCGFDRPLSGCRGTTAAEDKAVFLCRRHPKLKPAYIGSAAPETDQ